MTVTYIIVNGVLINVVESMNVMTVMNYSQMTIWYVLKILMNTSVKIVPISITINARNVAIGLMK